jgi:hypothetical protein
MNEEIREISSNDNIDHLDFSLATYNQLRRAGIESVGDLLETIENGSIHNIRGIGDIRYKEISEKVKYYRIVNKSVYFGNKSDISEKLDNIKLKEKIIPGEDETQLLKNQIYKLNNIIDDIILKLGKSISQQINIGILHPKARIFGNSLKNSLLLDNKLHCVKIYTKVICDTSITEELSFLLEDITSRNLNILVNRYGFSRLVLQEIADIHKITRERVRQILQYQSNKIAHRTKNSLELDNSINPLLRMQTALLIAKDLGESITYKKWSNYLLTSGLIGDTNIVNEYNYNPMEVFLTICNILSSKKINEFRIPENLKLAIQLSLENKSNTPVKNLLIVKSLPKGIKKQIKRQANFTGGINSRWLSHEISYSLSKTNNILCALGYEKIKNDWFISKKLKRRTKLNKHDPLEHTLRKMTQYCGPLTVDSICAGLRNAVSKTEYPIPPPKVMEKILDKCGYSCEENLWYWNGDINEDLNQGEQIILNCLKEKGPVVHHSELAQAFIDSKLSFASLHATLNRTPLIDHIDYALYKLRGAKVTYDEKKRATDEGDRIPVNLEVIPEKSGKIKVIGSLGILPIGTGVFYSENLPNFTGKWHCKIADKDFDNITLMKNEIRGLLKPFEYLECEVGDRVCMTFNTWNRSVSIEKMRKNENS